MGVWSRLGSVISSYLNDFEEQTSARLKTSGDPDLDAAYEELNDFLNRKEPRTSGKTGYSQHDAKYDSRKNAGSGGAKLPPEELRADFECLGVPFGADTDTCKAAYKKLLKIHHPDRHAGHEGNFKKATERSAKINAAWDRIEKWRNDGNRI
ncbi:MAG: J domain-containing protein [Treponema sp.]|jgi:DnaJ-class molecular chaperone|nr:J domain-containing protein [Treponema sp.]